MLSSYSGIVKYVFCFLLIIFTLASFLFYDQLTVSRANFFFLNPWLHHGTALKNGECQLTIQNLTNFTNPYSKAKEAGKLAGWLKKNYFDSIRKQFYSPLKYLRYLCPKNCGGLGNRYRGLVSDLYLALATNRLFDIQLDYPVNFNRFYGINDVFYELSPAEYSAKIPKTEDCLIFNTFTFNNYRDHDILIYQFYKLDPVNCISISSIDYRSLRILFQHPNLNQRLCPILTQFNVDIEILASAALKVILGRPTAHLEKEVERVTNSFQSTWSESTKIGVQVRLLFDSRPKWQEPEGRVCKGQVHCFINGTLRTIEKHRISNPIVFITGDNVDAINYLQQEFKSLNISTEINTIHGLPTHINDSPNGDWETHVRTYVDWILLSRMDYVVISESSYGTTARHMSLAPYLMLNHEASTTASCENFHSVVKDCVFSEDRDTQPYFEGSRHIEYNLYYSHREQN